MTSHRPPMKELLEEKPEARERNNKNRAIGHLLRQRYDALKELPKETMLEIIQDTLLYDRAWRYILQKHPSLRGSDYGEKVELEQRFISNLPYNDN